jgi:hypothetical protein
MKNASSRTELYVAGYFQTSKWAVSDKRRQKSGSRKTENLRQQLANQAVDLYRGVLIRSYVLDCRSTQQSLSLLSRKRLIILTGCTSLRKRSTGQYGTNPENENFKGECVW